jgi:hypothetical protein
MREFRKAVESQREIVFVLETDPQHGGVLLETHRAECPDEFKDLFDSVVEARRVVPWYRARDFQLVSLRRIAEVILGDGLYVPGSVTEAPLELEFIRSSYSHHIYVPPNAIAVGELLVEEAQRHGCELTTTSDPDQRHQAKHFLLYLNSDTYDSPGLEGEIENLLTGTHDRDRATSGVSKALAALKSASKAGWLSGRLALGSPDASLLLIHEQRDGHNQVPFSKIIGRTPKSLLDLNVYTDLALPLYGGEHQQTSLRTVLNQLAQPPLWGLRKLQRRVRGISVVKVGRTSTTRTRTRTNDSLHDGLELPQASPAHRGREPSQCAGSI